MRIWEDLSFTKKIVVGGLIVIAGILAPELMFLIDFGGLELAFTFLLMYFKPIINWLQPKYDSVTYHINIANVGFLNSAFFKPKVFITQTTFCCVAILLTGSIMLSASFLLPALLANGLLV